MSIERIRDYYKVPARRGGRVYYRYRKRYGTIKSARNGYLRIQLDGDKHSENYHPTWELNYLDKDGKVIYQS